MKRLFFLVPCVLCLIVFGCVQPSPAAEPVIRVVIAADGRAGFGTNLTADYRNMEKVFRENVPEKQLDLKLMAMDEITPDTILDTVAKTTCEPQDTLVVYYSGHAANDAGNGGHYFQLKDRNGKPVELQRRTLLAEMKKSRARLIVLLTDCCNIEQKSKESDKAASRVTGKPPARLTPVFQALFVEPEGVVDITSSKKGEASFVDNTGKKRGSCFTYPLVDLLEKHKQNSEITWPRFVAELKNEVHKAFMESWPEGFKFEPPLNGIYVQKTQTVEVYGTLPDDRNETTANPSSGPRFGVRAVNHSNGVRVTEIVPDGPGHRAGFEIGDIIIEINGKSIVNEGDYSDAIDASPKKIEMKVINVQDGKIIPVTFELGY